MATTNGHTNGHAAVPPITLYTNLGCPWAHRAHITLAELGLPFTTEIIPLDSPRTAAYLAINPRGLVPSLSYDGTIITESAIVSQFLADAHPSHLVKASTEPGAALQRARIAFFADAFVSKVIPLFYAGQRVETPEEKAVEGTRLVDVVVKELEPLLQDAAPFFGGSSKLTMAEVLTGPFLLRILAWPAYGLLAANLNEMLAERAPKFSKWASVVVAQKSVNDIFDADGVASKTKVRFAKMRAAAVAK